MNVLAASARLQVVLEARLPGVGGEGRRQLGAGDGDEERQAKVCPRRPEVELRGSVLAYFDAAEAHGALSGK